MAKPEMVLVYSTFPDPQQAEDMARDMVRKKLAACANIFAGMKSVYEWQGKIQSGEETAVLFKTLADKQEELSRQIRSRHPFDTPAIFGWPCSSVDADYLNWLKRAVKS